MHNFWKQISVFENIILILLQNVFYKVYTELIFKSSLVFGEGKGHL